MDIGYGLYWVANSISSTLIGGVNRSIQEMAHERNMEFQIEMERARNITEDRMMQEDVAFKRRLLSLSRQHRLEESTTSFSNQMQSVEIKSYLQQYWPLSQDLPSIILNDMNDGDTSQKLNVILMRTPFLPTKYGHANDEDTDIYKGIELLIDLNDAPSIGNVKFRRDACPKACMSGGNACIMNIHFLMSQLPTLVILPHYSEYKMHLTGAVWEAQGARPMTRHLLSFDFSSQDALECDAYRKRMIETLHTSVSIITGSVRDSYMIITQGREPTMPIWLNDPKHKRMKEIVMANDNIKNFIIEENRSTATALDVNKTPHLLDVYSRQDVESMKEKLLTTQIL